ncbi:hypothetical protein BU15DRAFT_86094 [Melanogaster broomeanus]|nr:hypothetical protein BU15DRAFT_86094 [Melanogaster broomeanus]
MSNIVEVETLRAILKELANQATQQYENDLCDELDSANLTSHHLTTDESGSSLDFYGETPTSSTTSDSSTFSHESFSSPLGFLQAALPHIPRSKLRRALSEAGAGDGGDDFDMEVAVEILLTNEYIRELEERGLDGLDDDETSPPAQEPIWTQVTAKRNGKAARKKNARGKTITIVDIRQKQHMSPSSTNSLTPPALDPWMQLSSLSDHLATLLPPHVASFFQSHFHSPNYSSPAKALRAALSSISGGRGTPSSGTTTTTLFTMLDVFRDSPTYSTLDAEQRATLYSDAQLALSATEGRGDDAIDIVWLLLELDLDLESGSLAMGVYHLPQPTPLSPSKSTGAWGSPVTSPTSPKPPDRVGGKTMRLPLGPPPTPPPPTSKRKGFSPAVSPTMTKPDPFEWQTIPQKPSTKGVHPLALHIPAYNNNNSNNNKRAIGGGKLSRPDLRKRMAESLRRRDELLREASKAWGRGNSKTRGGEVALYFAERARQFQELARGEALNEARIMVESKRSAAPDRSTVDLHGTCVSEAVAIVKEILEREGCSHAHPLKIITGRGTHSAKGVGVLKPAVRGALLRDGWNVAVWDGGLVVRGRNTTA